MAKEIVLDQIGRIKAPNPWTDLTSGCHLGYIYTDPQMTVKAYPHTAVWVPIGCSQGLWGRIGAVLTAVKVVKHHELRDKDPNEPLYRKWDRPS